jgi:NAD(P)-dependent dehydrogenase (short-subunit alcohol dehydrogenase family)
MRSLFFIGALTAFLAEPVAAETVLITGASRGLGLELTRQYAADGWNVIATARSPDDDADLLALAAEHENIRIETLDVTDHAEIEALASALAATPIDVLINNAGVLGDPGVQRLANLDFSSADVLFETNALGPLKVATAFLDNVAASPTKKIITISSIVGSMANTNGNIYFYRASKSAVNMLMRTLAMDTKDRGLIIGLIHPGVVDTDMSAPFDIPKVAVEDSAAGVRSVVAWYTAETSGEFMQYTGAPMAW